MGVGNSPGDEAPPATSDAAILRSLKPKWVDRDKLARRASNDRWINKLKAQREAKRTEPLPTAAESKRLWAEVQKALAAWLPIHFAPAYRQMELRRIDEKIRMRALALQGKMQRERVNSLRGSIGLFHLKKFGTGAGSRRTTFHGRLPPQVVTEILRQVPSA